LSKDAGPQQTLTDLIIDKIKKRDAHVSSGSYYYMILLFFFLNQFFVYFMNPSFRFLTGVYSSIHA
jgi:hypothetical protein